MIGKQKQLAVSKMSTILYVVGTQHLKMSYNEKYLTEKHSEGHNIDGNKPKVAAI